jgi:hypothetical protein
MFSRQTPITIKTTLTQKAFDTKQKGFSSYSILPILVTFKIEIVAYRVEILYGQILFLESLILDNFKLNWPYKSPLYKRKFQY